MAGASQRPRRGIKTCQIRVIVGPSSCQPTRKAKSDSILELQSPVELQEASYLSVRRVESERRDSCKLSIEHRCNLSILLILDLQVIFG